MRNLIAVLVTLAVVGTLGYGIYRFVLSSDPVVVGEEVDGLEAVRPRNMRIVDVQLDSFAVEWDVKTPVSGYVKYGDVSNSLALIAQDVEGTKPGTHHRVVVSGLSPGKKYYFWVMSDDTAFGLNGRSLEVLTLTR